VVSEVAEGAGGFSLLNQIWTCEAFRPGSLLLFQVLNLGKTPPDRAKKRPKSPYPPPPLVCIIRLVTLETSVSRKE